MKRAECRGKKIIAFFAAAGIAAGSTFPAYAAMLDNTAAEQNTTAQMETEQTYQDDIIALDDIGISVQVSDYTAIRQDDGFVYIYTMADDSICYHWKI